MNPPLNEAEGTMDAAHGQNLSTVETLDSPFVRTLVDRYLSVFETNEEARAQWASGLIFEAGDRLAGQSVDRQIRFVTQRCIEVAEDLHQSGLSQRAVPREKRRTMSPTACPPVSRFLNPFK
ncbi:MAG: hypothetical protein AAF664_03270 [Planctomycetota bacterium]